MGKNTSMMKDNGGDQFQYLMIFLKEPPSDGVAGFQNQIINRATYIAEGSTEACLFNDFVGEDTKLKVLVTGEIELNEKNVFIGLKMAFPEWDFQHYPLNMQKLFLKRPTWSEVKEVGVIATIERTRTLGENKWGLPCVIDLSADQEGRYMGSMVSKEIHSLYESEPIKKTKSKEKVDLFGDFLNKMTDEEEMQEAYGGIEFDPTLVSSDLGFRDEAQEDFSLDTLDHSGFDQSPSRDSDILREEDLLGVDRREPLEGFGGITKTSPFKDLDEAGSFDFDFLKEYESYLSSLDKTDLEENVVPNETIHASPFFDHDDEFISPQFLEPELEFKLEGVLEETSIEDDPSLMNFNENVEGQGLFEFKKLRKYISSFLYMLSDKLQILPLGRISRILLLAGIVLITLSFTAKILEPDYEAIRKAAGITDVYDWIIMNDLVGSDTDDVFELWKKSSEYRQFWFWFDTEWTPKINRYNEIVSGVRTLGAVLFTPGLLILSIPFLARAISGRDSKKAGTFDFGNTNKVSLSFATYTTDWSSVDNWAKETGFKNLEAEDTRRLYRKKGKLSHPPILSLISIVDGQVQLEFWVSTRVPTILIPVLADMGLDVLEAKNAVLPGSIKDSINKLLLKLGHPPLA